MTTRESRQNWLRRTACAALLATMTAAATGCAQGANAEVLFDFTQGGEAGKSISFELPDGLAEVALEESTLLAMPVRAESVTVDSSSLCAVDVTYEYEPGFLDSLELVRERNIDHLEDRHREEVDTFWNDFEEDWNVRTFEEAQARIDTGQGRLFGLPITDEDLDAQERLDHAIQGEESLSESYEEERKEILSTPLHQYVEDQITNQGWPTFDRDEFDSSEPARGLYFSEDLAQIRAVFACALDPGTDTGWPMRTIIRNDNGTEDVLASAVIASMANGDILITETAISGYAIDSNGDWVKR